MGIIPLTKCCSPLFWCTWFHVQKKRNLLYKVQKKKKKNLNCQTKMERPVKKNMQEESPVQKYILIRCMLKQICARILRVCPQCASLSKPCTCPSPSTIHLETLVLHWDVKELKVLYLFGTWKIEEGPQEMGRHILMYQAAHTTFAQLFKKYVWIIFFFFY